jgi:hypothetical protein
MSLAFSIQQPPTRQDMRQRWRQDIKTLAMLECVTVALGIAIVVSNGLDNTLWFVGFLLATSTVVVTMVILRTHRLEPGKDLAALDQRPPSLHHHHQIQRYVDHVAKQGRGLSPWEIMELEIWYKELESMDQP